MGASIGAAIAGMRPLPEIMFMDFLGVAFDQLANHAAKLRYMSGGRTPVPMTVRVNMVGGTPIGAQHSQSLEAILMHTPGLKVVVAVDAVRRQGAAARLHRGRGPVRVHREHGVVHEAGHGAHRAVHDPDRVRCHPARGDDVTIISYGRLMYDVEKAAEQLDGEGISAEVIDLRSLAPIDTDTLARRRWRGPSGRSSSTRRCARAGQVPRSPPACTKSCTTSWRHRCAASRPRIRRCRRQRGSSPCSIPMPTPSSPPAGR